MPRSHSSSDSRGRSSSSSSRSYSSASTVSSDSYRSRSRSRSTHSARKRQRSRSSSPARGRGTIRTKGRSEENPTHRKGFFDSVSVSSHVEPPQSTTAQRVVVPTLPAQLTSFLDLVATYVSVGGPAVEEELKLREANNPYFRFLHCDWQEPSAVYYRWRLYSLCQGDTLLSWRVRPYQMEEGEQATVWVPPPLPQQQVQAQLPALGLLDMRQSAEAALKQSDTLAGVIGSATTKQVANHSIDLLGCATPEEYASLSRIATPSYASLCGVATSNSASAALLARNVTQHERQYFAYMADADTEALEGLLPGGTDVLGKVKQGAHLYAIRRGGRYAQFQNDRSSGPWLQKYMQLIDGTNIRDFFAQFMLVKAEDSEVVSKMKSSIAEEFAKHFEVPLSTIVPYIANCFSFVFALDELEGEGPKAPRDRLDEGTERFHRVLLQRTLLDVNSIGEVMLCALQRHRASHHVASILQSSVAKAAAIPADTIRVMPYLARLLRSEQVSVLLLEQASSNGLEAARAQCVEAAAMLEVIPERLAAMHTYGLLSLLFSVNDIIANSCPGEGLQLPISDVICTATSPSGQTLTELRDQVRAASLSKYDASRQANIEDIHSPQRLCSSFEAVLPSMIESIAVYVASVAALASSQSTSQRVSIVAPLDAALAQGRSEAATQLDTPLSASTAVAAAQLLVWLRTLVAEWAAKKALTLRKHNLLLSKFEFLA